MNVDDESDFRELLTGYYAFKRQNLSRFVVDVWINAMRPYDFAAVKDAFNRHIVDPDKGQYLAQPADVVKIIEGGTADRALVAWSKVDAAVKHIGGYDSVVFDDPAIHSVIADMGGWIQLCAHSDIEEWPFKAIEFQKRYRVFSAGRSTEFPRVLVGRVEADCSMRGLPAPAPRTMGERAKCIEVWRGGSQDTPAHKRIGTLVKEITQKLIDEKRKD